MLQWYYLTLVASVLMGGATLIEKQALKAEHAMAYSASFSIVAAIIALTFAPLADFSISALSLALIIVASAISTTTYWLMARIYRHGSVATATSVYTALPMLFIVILAFLLLGEKLTAAQYVAIAVLFAATYMIMFRGRRQFEKEKYIEWLTFASLLSAAYTIVLKYVLFSVSPYTYLVLSNIFVAIFMVVMMQIRYGGITEIFGNMRIYKIVILSVSVLTIAYRITYYLAASVEKISLVWPLLNIPYVIMIVFMGGALFKEGSVARKAVLAVIMIVAAYFLVYW